MSMQTKPWYLQIMESKYSIVEETRKALVSHELNLNSRWGQDIQEEVNASCIEQTRKLESSMIAMTQCAKGLDKKEEFRMLELEGIAGIVNVKERTALKKTRQMKLIRRKALDKTSSLNSLRSEFRHNLLIYTSLQELHRSVRQTGRTIKNNELHDMNINDTRLLDDKECVDEMRKAGELLREFGNNLTTSSYRIINLSHEKVNNMLEKARLERERSPKTTHQSNILELVNDTGMILNVNAIEHDYVEICNGKTTIRHKDTPSSRPRWAYVRASRGFSLIPRERGLVEEWKTQIGNVSDDTLDVDSLLTCLERAFLVLDIIRNSNRDIQRKKRAILTDELNILARNSERSRIKNVHKELLLRIRPFGTEFGNLIHNEKINNKAKLHELTQKILKELSKHAKSCGEFYFEIHSHSRNHQWVIGLHSFFHDIHNHADDDTTYIPIDLTRIPSSSLSSSLDNTNTTSNNPSTLLKHSESYMALFSDGSIVVNGKRFPAISSNITDLRDVTVLGILIDVHIGRLSIRADGAETFNIIFGDGAPAFNPEEQLRQAKEIIGHEYSYRLLPFFGLLGSKPRKKQHNEQTLSPTQRELQKLNIIHEEKDNDNEHHETTNTIISGITPQLSVNFGSFSFFNQPKGAAPANMLSFAETIRQTQLIESLSLSLNTNKRPSKQSKHSRQSSINNNNLMNRINNIEDDDIKELLQKRKLQEINREKSLLASWSRFPPQDIKVHQAVLTLQKYVKRWASRRAKRRMYIEKTNATRTLQKQWRKTARRRKERKIRACVPIQALVRGFMVRKRFMLCKQLGISYKDGRNAAIKIQSWWRMILSQKLSMVMAAILQDKIEFVNNYVILLQRIFRAKRARHSNSVTRRNLESILTVQKLFRGIRLRRRLVKIDPHQASKMFSIQKQMKNRFYREQKALDIQRLYRGYIARLRYKKRKAQLRLEMRLFANAYKSHIMRKKIDRYYTQPQNKYQASLLKVFFAALLYSDGMPTSNSIRPSNSRYISSTTPNIMMLAVQRKEDHDDNDNNNDPFFHSGMKHLENLSKLEQIDEKKGTNDDDEIALAAANTDITVFDDAEEELEDEREIDRMRAMGTLL